RRRARLGPTPAPRAGRRRADARRSARLPGGGPRAVRAAGAELRLHLRDLRAVVEPRRPLGPALPRPRPLPRPRLVRLTSPCHPARRAARRRPLPRPAPAGARRSRPRPAVPPTARGLLRHWAV